MLVLKGMVEANGEECQKRVQKAGLRFFSSIHLKASAGVYVC